MLREMGEVKSSTHEEGKLSMSVEEERDEIGNYLVPFLSKPRRPLLQTSVRGEM